MVMKKLLLFIIFLNTLLNNALCTSYAIPQDLINERQAILNLNTRQETLQKLDDLNRRIITLYIQYITSKDQNEKKSILDQVKFIYANLTAAVREQLNKLDDELYIQETVKKIYIESQNIKIAQESIGALEAQYSTLQNRIKILETSINNNTTLTPAELTTLIIELNSTKSKFEATSENLNIAKNIYNTALKRYQAEKAELSEYVEESAHEALLQEIVNTSLNDTNHINAINDAITITAQFFRNKGHILDEVETLKYTYIKDLNITKSKKPFTIVNAWYGQDDNLNNLTSDVVKVLQLYATQGLLLVPHSQQAKIAFFGKDPLPGKPKHLYIQMQLEEAVLSIKLVNQGDDTYFIYGNKTLIKYFEKINPENYLLQQLTTQKNTMSTLSNQLNQTTNDLDRSAILQRMLFIMNSIGPTINNNLNTLSEYAFKFEEIREANALIPFIELFKNSFLPFNSQLDALVSDGFIYKETVAIIESYFTKYGTTWTAEQKQLWQYKLEKSRLYEDAINQIKILEQTIASYQNRFDFLKQQMDTSFGSGVFLGLLSPETNEIIASNQSYEASLNEAKNIINQMTSQTLLKEELETIIAQVKTLTSNIGTLKDYIKIKETVDTISLKSAIISLLQQRMQFLRIEEEKARQIQIEISIKNLNDSQLLIQNKTNFEKEIITLTQEKNQSTNIQEIEIIDMKIAFAQKMIALINPKVRLALIAEEQTRENNLKAQIEASKSHDFLVQQEAIFQAEKDVLTAQRNEEQDAVTKEILTMKINFAISMITRIGQLIANVTYAEIDAAKEFAWLENRQKLYLAKKNELSLMATQTNDTALRNYYNTRSAMYNAASDRCAGRILVVLKEEEIKRQTTIKTEIEASKDVNKLIDIQKSLKTQEEALITKKANETNTVTITIIDMQIKFAQDMYHLIRTNMPPLLTEEIKTITNIETINQRIVYCEEKLKEYEAILPTVLNNDTWKKYYQSLISSYKNFITTLNEKLTTLVQKSETDRLAPIRTEIQAIKDITTLRQKQSEFETQLSTLTKQKATNLDPIQRIITDVRIAFANEMIQIIKNKILALLKEQGANEEEILRQEIAALSELNALNTKLKAIQIALQEAKQQKEANTDPLQVDFLTQKVTFYQAMIVELLKKIFALEIKSIQSDNAQIIADRNLENFNAKDIELQTRQQELLQLKQAEPHLPLKNLYDEHSLAIQTERNILKQEKDLLIAEKQTIATIESLTTKTELQSQLQKLQTEAAYLSQQVSQTTTTSILTKRLQFLQETAIPFVKSKIAKIDEEAAILSQKMTAQQEQQRTLLEEITRLNNSNLLSTKETELKTTLATLKEQLANANAQEKQLLENNIPFIEQILQLIPQLKSILQQTLNATDLEATKQTLQNQASTLQANQNQFIRAQGAFILQVAIPLIEQKIAIKKASDEALQAKITKQEEEQKEILQILAEIKTIQTFSAQHTQFSQTLDSFKQRITTSTNEEEKILLQHQITFLESTLPFIIGLIEEIKGVNALKTESDLKNKTVALQTQATTLLRSTNRFDQAKGYFIYHTLTSIVQEKIALIIQQNDELQKKLTEQRTRQQTLLTEIAAINTINGLQTKQTNLNSELTTQQQALNATTDTNQKTIIKNQIVFLEETLQLLSNFIKLIQETNALINQAKTTNDQNILNNKNNELQNEAYTLIKSTSIFERTKGTFLLKVITPLIQTTINTMLASQEELRTKLEAQRKTQEPLKKEILAMTSKDALHSTLLQLQENLKTEQNKLNTATSEDKPFITAQVNFLNYMIQSINTIINHLNEIEAANTSTTLSPKVQQLKTDFETYSSQYYEAANNPEIQRNILDQISIIRNMYTIANQKLATIQQEELTVKKQFDEQKEQQNIFRQQITQLVDKKALESQLSVLQTQYEELKAYTPSNTTEETLVRDHLEFLAYIIELIPLIIGRIEIIEQTNDLPKIILTLKSEFDALVKQYETTTDEKEKAKVLDQTNIVRTLFTFANEKQTKIVKQQQENEKVLAAQKKEQEATRQQIMTINDLAKLETMKATFIAQKANLTAQTATITNDLEKNIHNNNLIFTDSMIDLINKKIENLTRVGQEKILAQQALWQEQFTQSSTITELQALVAILQSQKKVLDSSLLTATSETQKTDITKQITFIDDLFQKTQLKIEELNTQANNTFQQELLKIQGEQQVMEQQINALTSIKDLASQKLGLEQQRAMLEQEITLTTDPNKQKIIQTHIDFITKMLQLIETKTQTLQKQETDRQAVGNMNEKELLEQFNILNKEYISLQQQQAMQPSLTTANRMKFIEELYQLINARLMLLAQIKQLNTEEKTALTQVEEQKYVNAEKEETEIEKLKDNTAVNTKIEELNKKLSNLNTLKAKIQDPATQALIDKQINAIKDLFIVVNKKLQNIIIEQKIIDTPKTPADPQLEALPETSKPITTPTNAPKSKNTATLAVTTTGTIINMQNVTQSIEEQNLLNQVMQLDKNIADLQIILSNVKEDTPYQRNLQDRLSTLLQNRETYIKQITALRSGNLAGIDYATSSPLTNTTTGLENTTGLNFGSAGTASSSTSSLSSLASPLSTLSSLTSQSSMPWTQSTSGIGSFNTEKSISTDGGFNENAFDMDFDFTDNLSSSITSGPTPTAASSTFTASQTTSNTGSSTTTAPGLPSWSIQGTTANGGTTISGNSTKQQSSTTLVIPTGGSTQTQTSGTALSSSSPFQSNMSVTTGGNAPMQQNTPANQNVQQVQQQVAMVKEFTDRFIQNMIALRTFHTNQAVRLQNELNNIEPNTTEYVNLAQEYNQHVAKVNYYQQVITSKITPQSTTQ